MPLANGIKTAVMELDIKGMVPVNEFDTGFFWRAKDKVNLFQLSLILHSFYYFFYMDCCIDFSVLNIYIYIHTHTPLWVKKVKKKKNEFCEMDLGSNQLFFVFCHFVNVEGLNPFCYLDSLQLSSFLLPKLYLVGFTV